eukprot:4342722-Amphidinium_carterae.1
MDKSDLKSPSLEGTKGVFVTTTFVTRVGFLLSHKSAATVQTSKGFRVKSIFSFFSRSCHGTDAKEANGLLLQLDLSHDNHALRCVVTLKVDYVCNYWRNKLGNQALVGTQSEPDSADNC